MTTAIRAKLYNRRPHATDARYRTTVYRGEIDILADGQLLWPEGYEVQQEHGDVIVGTLSQGEQQ